MKQIKLKTINEGFLWGGSLSAVQVDGKGPNEIRRSKILHDYQYQKYPNKHWSGVGPDVTIDFMNRYKEDINMFAQIGVNSIRYGFQWARLFPDGETLNPKAAEYYHNVIDYFLKNNIDPMMQLFHFDTPMWVKRVGGWTSDIVYKRFAKFAKFIFEEYGEKINYFCTFNEPAVMKSFFYEKDWYQDGIVTTKKVLRECVGLIKSNTAAYNEFIKAKEKGYLKPSTKLGVVVNYNKAYPIADSPSKEDLESVKNLDAFMNTFWTDALVKGFINKRVKDGLLKNGIIFPISEEEEKYISNTDLDFIGENYYLPWRGKKPKSSLPNKSHPESSLFEVGIKPGARMNKFRGWEIYPEGLTETLIDLWNLYKKPIYIGENGMGVDNEHHFRKNGIINDEYRISFVKEHIEAMQKAIDQGVNIFGYHMWSMIDLWSSYNAFKNRYGLIEVDLDNNLTRRFKKSAYWYKDFIKKGTINLDYKKCDEITKEAMEKSVKIQKDNKNIGKQNYETLFKEL